MRHINVCLLFPKIDCVIETENPNDVPWSAMLIYQIGNQPKYFQPVAIIDKNIVTIRKSA